MEPTQPNPPDAPARAAPARQQPATAFRIGEWLVEPRLNRLSRTGEEVRLEPKVMTLLVYLAGRPGELVPREELESVVWAGTVVSYDALTGAVQKLRKALGDNPRDPRIIETISKKGYRFIGEVQGMPSGSAAGGPAVAAAARGTAGKRRLRPGWWLALAALPVLVLVVWLALVQRPGVLSAGGLAPATPSGPSIAVLPFENLSAGSGQAYFSAGITQDLITELSKTPGLLVIARNSVFPYRDSPESPQAIGQALGARYLVTGSVQRMDRRLRINARLVEAASGRTLWAERFDRELSDVLAVQDEITRRIVTSLQVSLAAEDREALGHRFATRFEAYDLFLQAQHEYGRSLEGNRAARELYRRVIELEPAFARAYGGLALTHFRDALEAYTDSPEDSIRKASALAERALALDPGLPQVHLVKSQVQMFKKDYAGAVEELNRALELRPSYADAYASLGWTLHFAGELEPAEEAVERAIRLNPVIPVAYHVVLGGIHYTTGRYREAVELLEQGRRMNPEHYRLRLWLAAAYAQSGRLEDARWEVDELLALNPAPSAEVLGQMFPFRDPAHLDHLVQGLRKAGMPR